MPDNCEILKCLTACPSHGMSLVLCYSFLKDRKASVLQLPERIEFINAMPFTKAEKVDKRSLKEDIKQKMGIS